MSGNTEGRICGNTWRLKVYFRNVPIRCPDQWHKISLLTDCGRSPGVPATQSVAIVQVFPAFSCEPAIRTKQIIMGVLKLSFSSDGAQPQTDVRQCTNHKPERTAKIHERLIQILCNSIFTRRLYSMLRIQVSHKSIFLAYPHVCFTISLLMQDFAQSISVLNISEWRRKGKKRLIYFLYNGAEWAPNASFHLGDKVLNN